MSARLARAERATYLTVVTASQGGPHGGPSPTERRRVHLGPQAVQ